MTIEPIELKLLVNNEGQIPEIKANPRDLTAEGFELAKKSILDFPEMLEVRTLVVVELLEEHNGKYLVIGGNQRLRALKALNYTNAPCMVVNWTSAKINEFIIKDNLPYGKWDYDLLANEWPTDLLVEWGLELPIDIPTEIEEDIEMELKEYKLEIECQNQSDLQELHKELSERGLKKSPRFIITLPRK